MVKHVILWKLKETFSEAEKTEIKKNAKRELESLVGKIEGLLYLEVVTEGLSSSTADFMLDSEFENQEALKAYSMHPAHVAVANAFVRPFTAERSCFDFFAEE